MFHVCPYAVVWFVMYVRVFPSVPCAYCLRVASSMPGIRPMSVRRSPCDACVKCKAVANQQTKSQNKTPSLSFPP
ncbi:hypothetical protein B0T16DRAFT_59671 [Cercophora newfieldiana]|uniref:Secreted protein n=1 Tax=Cercophora newfieldiana TaxID=92897 RepID=A0AA39YRN9_9PEZI|nr:hypothetical protein B0T16DRAFT_59671 [Cercophora newfieldiana]